jgi:hypothetical protein
LTNVTIINPDGGDFTLGILEPKSLTVWTSGKLNTNMSAWDFNLAVREYYSKYYGSWINVYKTMYLDDGSVTTQTNLATKVIFTI